MKVADPAGALRASKIALAILSNEVLIRNVPQPNEKNPLSRVSFVWLGDKDSNLGWRSQSPQSYR